MTDSEQTVTFTLSHNAVTYVDNGDGTHDGTCECGTVVADDQAHSYENGICACHRREIRGVHRDRTLLLEGTIIVKATIAFMNNEQTKNAVDLSNEYVLKNGQILFWSMKDMPADASAAVLGTETSAGKLVNAGKYQGIQEFYAESHGIAAKEYNDKIYYRTYIVVDGKEYYGDIIEYSVVTYCEIQLAKTNEAINKVKPVLAAMLNYGAAAQLNFKYKTDELANACLQKYVDQGLLDAKYLSMQWDASMLTDVVVPDAAMTVNFQQNEAARTDRALVLDGAVEVKTVFAYKIKDNKGTKLPADGKITVYYWTRATYEALQASGQALTKENATYSRTGEEITHVAYHSTYGYEYAVYSDGVAAKELGNTIYVAAVFTMADGTEYCSGVDVYSPEMYAKGRIESANATEILKNVVKWMVIYGEAAKTYFGTK
jgi:hypothetical protein